jgi:hypothetical protein
MLADTSSAAHLANIRGKPSRAETVISSTIEQAQYESFP